MPGLGAIATLAAAVALYFSTGLEPLWPLAWVAPWPVLAVAYRASAGLALVVAFSAWALGHVHFWTFLHGALRVPPAVVVLIIVGPAVVFAFAVLASRSLIKRGSAWSAALVVPAMWVSAEHLVARLSPHGTAGSLAYSQADVLPLVQLASVTGLAGVTFLVMAVPTAAAVATYRPIAPGRRRTIALVTLLAVAGTLAFGAWRLTRPMDGAAVTVGLAASDLHVRRFNSTDRQEALPVVEAFTGAIDALAARGASIIVLPEKLVGVTDAYRAEIKRLLAGAAARNRVVVVAGLNEIAAPLRRNIALVFSPDGTLAGSYLKQHLIPGIESGYVVGDASLVLPMTAPPSGVAICKDLDFPALGRHYAGRDAALMLVPAWDFVVDGRQHERMAAMRGVESGFAIARAAHQGLLTVRDNRGRLVAETRSDAAPLAMVAATVKVRHDATVYARYGDWFAWLCVIATAVLLARLAIPTTAPRQTTNE